MKSFNECSRTEKTAIVVGAIAVLTTIILAAGVGYTYAFKNEFYPGITIGTVPVSGLSMEEARNRVNNRVTSIFDGGIDVNIGGKHEVLDLQIFSATDPDNAQDLVNLDTEAALQTAYRIGREGNILERGIDIFTTAIRKPQIIISVETYGEGIEKSLLAAFGEFYDPAINPRFNIERIGRGWSVQTPQGSSGRSFDMPTALKQIEDQLSVLDAPRVDVQVVDREPDFSQQDAEALTGTILQLLAKAPYPLAYTSDDSRVFTFNLTAAQLADTLQPVLNSQDEVVLSLGDGPESLLEEINNRINVDSLNARFDVHEDGRVERFQPSRNGREVNIEQTIVAMEAFINNLPQPEEGTSYNPIDISVEVKEAEIQTADVNDLGITELLGTGISNFAGSPYNRRGNIRHGVEKLNGILIAPDEEFSLINALKPFTIADGYLPELVIKGDEIKPEVGGGLCQIGSTTFRAVMNSGLNVTQRRNHSLVVSYYNDLTNGNPGTDATIYDPAPDFRFVNDTGNYILLSTEMDEENSELRFSFWGTNDGRNGYYSPPVVHNWIPTGPTRVTYTTALAPGQRQCQSRHPGANTSFTYTVERPDGEVEETVFESHYRPLPEICLVGVEPERLGPDGELIPLPDEPAEVEEASEVE